MKRPNGACRAFRSYYWWTITGWGAESLEKPSTAIRLAVRAQPVQISYLDEGAGSGPETGAYPVGVSVVADVVVDSPDCDVSGVYVVAVGATYGPDLIPIISTGSKSGVQGSLPN